MTETNEVWRTMRRMVAPYGRFKRIENRCEIGTPDVNYTLLHPFGLQGWVELKLFPKNGNPPPHLTLDQIIWGENEVRVGGRWHLFGRCDKHWRLYDTAGARRLFERKAPDPIFNISGRFPLTELLQVLGDRRQ